MDINIQLGQLKKLLDITIACDHDDSFVIKRIASLEDANANDLAVILDRGDASVFEDISTKKIERSSAGLILATRSVVPGKPYALVKDPLDVFTKIVHFIRQQQSLDQTAPTIAKNAFVHPTAVVEPGAIIGEKSIISAHAYVGRFARIGSYVHLHPGAKILDECVVGDGSIIHSGAIIGADGFGYKVTEQGLDKIPQIGIVKIGKLVEIGANSTIDRAAFKETVIGDKVKLDNMVHIAHNVHVGAATAILAQTVIGGSTKIGIGCQIGGQVAIKDNITIGNQVKIVSKAGVMTDLEDGAVVAGVPSMPFNKWKRLIVILNHLPEMVSKLKKIEKIANAYQQKKSWWKRLFS